MKIEMSFQEMCNLVKGIAFCAFCRKKPAQFLFQGQYCCGRCAWRIERGEERKKAKALSMPPVNDKTGCRSPDGRF